MAETRDEDVGAIKILNAVSPDATRAVETVGNEKAAKEAVMGIFVQKYAVTAARWIIKCNALETCFQNGDLPDDDGDVLDDTALLMQAASELAEEIKKIDKNPELDEDSFRTVANKASGFSASVELMAEHLGQGILQKARPDRPDSKSLAEAFAGEVMDRTVGEMYELNGLTGMINTAFQQARSGEVKNVWQKLLAGLSK